MRGACARVTLCSEYKTGEEPRVVNIPGRLPKVRTYLRSPCVARTWSELEIDEGDLFVDY
jgi:hypothetical protein